MNLDDTIVAIATAPGQGGRYVVFIVAGHTIEVTIGGADLDLGQRLSAIDASTRTLSYTGDPG